MKNVRKVIGFVLSVVLLCTCFLPFCASAAGSCTLSASKVSGKKGDVVTVTISISTIQAASFQVFVNFDSSALEFQSVSKGNAGGNMPFSEANASSSSQVRYAAFGAENVAVSGTVMTIRFKVLASSGSSSVTMDAAVYDASGEDFTVTTSNGTVSVTPAATQPAGTTAAATQPAGTTATAAAKSSDATLKSMVVRGVTDSGNTTVVSLSPAFSSSVTSYSASVAGDVARLAVTATANDSKARVSIPAGYLRMDVGNNVTRVIVTAEDGTQKTYTIRTVKADAGASVTEATTDEIYTQALPQEETEAPATDTTVAQESTNPLTQQNVTEPTTAEASGNTPSEKRDIYIKLGVVFGVVALTALGVSVALFINEGRKRQKDD